MKSAIVSPQNYYQAVSVILETVVSVIVENENDIPVISERFKGRSGSSYFEDEFLKPLIRKHDNLYYDAVNIELKSRGLNDSIRFISIDASENLDEASARSMEDISVYMEFEGSVHQERINIKATSGKTSDNVGGWEGLSYAVYGNQINPVKTRKAFLEQIQKNIKIDNSLHDYFLWVFKKNEKTGREILQSSKTYSLLNVSLDSFFVNMNQAFPLQFNHSKAEFYDFSKISVSDSKVAMISRILMKSNEYYERQKEENLKAQNALNMMVSELSFET